MSVKGILSAIGRGIDHIATAEQRGMGASDALYAEYRREVKRMPTYGPRGEGDRKKFRALFEAIARGDMVIVRRYFQMVVASKTAMQQFEQEANILARHGYKPEGQVFSPNGALTGGLFGQGEHTVTFVRVA